MEDEKRGIRTQHDVSQNLVISHLDVANGDTHAKNLLQLELNGRANLIEFVVQVLSVRHGGGELAGWVCEAMRYNNQYSAMSEAVVTFSPLERPGPSKRGICLMRVSEARKASYFLASFLTSFLFLLSLG